MEKALGQFDARPSSILIFNKCKQVMKRLPRYLDPDQFRREFLRATLLLEHGRYRVLAEYRLDVRRLGSSYRVVGVQLVHPDEFPYMARRVDLGTFDTREQGAEVVPNGGPAPAGLVGRLNAYCERGAASDRELARAAGRTVAKFGAEATARDPWMEDDLAPARSSDRPPTT